MTQIIRNRDFWVLDLLLRGNTYSHFILSACLNKWLRLNLRLNSHTHWIMVGLIHRIDLSRIKWLIVDLGSLIVILVLNVWVGLWLRTN